MQPACLVHVPSLEKLTSLENNVDYHTWRYYHAMHEHGDICPHVDMHVYTT